MQLKEILEDIKEEEKLEACFFLTSTGLILEGATEERIKLNAIFKKIYKLIDGWERGTFQEFTINHEDSFLQGFNIDAPEIEEYFFLIIMSKYSQINNIERQIGKLIEWVFNYYKK